MARSQAIAATIDQVQAHVQDQAVAQEATNPLANLWLGILAVCLGGTLFCTAVLVAWPIIAKMVAS